MAIRRHAAPAPAGVTPDPPPAPAGVRVTVTGKPVFAVGRWFQPGVTALPDGYLRPRQLDELRQHPRVQVSVTP